MAGGPGATSSGGLIEKCYAAGSLQTVINSEIYSYDEIYTGGINGGDNYYSYGTVSSSAAMTHSIAAVDQQGARIVPVGTGTLANNIAFNGMLVNGATVTDAASDPQNDVNGLGKTAAQLASQSTYETGLGWDFAAVWEMGPSDYPYPILQWQNGAVPVPPGFALLEN